jgi:hypothetical protein
VPAEQNHIEANKPQIKELLIKNTENKHFEIESISSKQDCIKVISQQPDNDKIRLVLQITPPLMRAEVRYFSGDLFIKIKDDETLTINCRGFYRHNYVKDKATK